MRFLTVAGLISCVLLFALAGCEEGPSQEVPEQLGVTAAIDISDGTQKWYDGQMTCPVCGGQPISGEHYVDLPGGRLYFDKAECKQKFQENQEQYLQEYSQKVQQQMGGG